MSCSQYRCCQCHWVRLETHCVEGLIFRKLAFPKSSPGWGRVWCCFWRAVEFSVQQRPDVQFPMTIVQRLCEQKNDKSRCVTETRRSQLDLWCYKRSDFSWRLVPCGIWHSLCVGLCASDASVNPSVELPGSLPGGPLAVFLLVECPPLSRIFHHHVLESTPVWLLFVPSL